MLSSRSVARLPPPKRMSLLIARSVEFRHGEYAPGKMRGALPNVPVGAVEHARSFKYRSAFGSARSRSVMLPGFRNGCPSTMFGRWAAPSRLVLLVLWLTPIGKPLCIWITAEIVQLPRMALATLL